MNSLFLTGILTVVSSVITSSHCIGGMCLLTMSLYIKQYISQNTMVNKLFLVMYIIGQDQIMRQLNEVTQRFHPPRCDVDVTQYGKL